ncbi:uncharacterized protein C8R40DRAFT_1164743 [Lentinula edodes]|uniref:uncharacterized protein n=1 Tax=Lentinula edodes TaxID=5353 RepID=UPI001E8EBB97|nr:uncharacterized protein C8R40DRAFT_1164743 [Lentinula edodes]KAH7881334.1 hypothetical protein C8R40DRAFT_1164743 [Lentinula edodes]
MPPHTSSTHNPSPFSETHVSTSLLSMLEEEIFARSHAASQSSSKLVFISPPNKDTSFVLPDPESLTSANYGQFALKTTAPANREFLEHEAWFCGAVIQLHLMPRGDGDKANILEDYALNALTSLNQHKKSQWIQQSDPIGAHIIDNRGSAALY